MIIYSYLLIVMILVGLGCEAGEGEPPKSLATLLVYLPLFGRVLGWW